MQKLFKSLTTGCVLVVLSLFIVTNANGQNSKFAVCKYTLSELLTGNHNTEIVNASNMTGAQVIALLNKRTMDGAGVSIYDFNQKGTQQEITTTHYNMQALNSGLSVYFDRTPSGHKKVFNGVEIKEECCNPLSTDAGILNNLAIAYKNGQCNSPSGGSNSTGQTGYQAPCVQCGDQQQQVIVVTDGGKVDKRSFYTDDQDDKDVERERNRMIDAQEDFLALKKSVRKDETETIEHAKHMANALGYTGSSALAWIFGIGLLIVFLVLGIRYMRR